MLARLQIGTFRVRVRWWWPTFSSTGFREVAIRQNYSFLHSFLHIMGSSTFNSLSSVTTYKVLRQREQTGTGFIYIIYSKYE